MIKEITKRKLSPSPALLGASLVVLSSLFYGSYGIWARLMGDSFGPYAQAALKSALVVLFLLLLGGVKKWQKIQWRRDQWWLLTLLISSALVAAPLYYAINRVGVSGWRRLVCMAEFCWPCLCVAGFLMASDLLPINW